MQWVGADDKVSKCLEVISTGLRANASAACPGDTALFR